MRAVVTISLFALTAACGRIGYDELDAATRPRDAGALDAGAIDSGRTDAGMVPVDAGMIPIDAGSDAGTDAGPPIDITALSDEFDGALGPQWSVINPELSTVTFSSSEVVVTPVQVGQWFGNGYGIAIVTPITGDFVASAHVRVFRAGTLDPPIGPAVELGGIIARDPASTDGMENHVWGGIGAYDGVPSRESKSTTNSSSVFSIDGYAEAQAIVRLCRFGDTFTTYHYSFSGPPYVEHLTWERADLPSTLDVGVFASEGSDPVDIEVRIDWIHFRRPSSLADCAALP
jgi:hypothetical protein